MGRATSSHLLSSIHDHHSHRLYGSSSTALSRRRDQWSIIMLRGLMVGIGVATLLQSIIMLRGHDKPPPSPPASSSTSSSPPARRRSSLPFPFSLFFSSFSSTNNLSHIPKGKRPKILLFGDSLTQRGYEGPGQGWAAALSHAYSRRADIVNRGFSGYTAKWCSFMLETLFPLEDASWEIPSLAVIFLGANDAALPSRDQHVPVVEYEHYLKAIVYYLKKRSKKYGVETRFLMLTPPPVDEERWGAHCKTRGRALDRKNEVTRLYARACVNVAKELSVPVVDLWTLLGGEDKKKVSPHLLDGLHLSGKGNGKVAEAVLDAIEREFPEMGWEAMKMQAPEHFDLSRESTVIEVV